MEIVDISNFKSRSVVSYGIIKYILIIQEDNLSIHN